MSAVPQEFLRLPQVLKCSGYSRTTLYKRIADGLFPKGKKDGRITIWASSHIAEWQEKKLQG